MKLCKVIERELKYRLFDKWTATVRSSIGKNGVREMRNSATESGVGNYRTGNVALDILAKRQKVDLGSMRHLLLAVRQENSHPAIVSLSRFLDSFGDAQWLLSEECDVALNLISSRFRNGGVHEHLVDYSLCTEAMEYLLKSADAALPKVLNATNRNCD